MPCQQLSSEVKTTQEFTGLWRIEEEGEFPDPGEYAKVFKMVRQLDLGELELVDYEDVKFGLGFTDKDLK